MFRIMKLRLHRCVQMLKLPLTSPSDESCQGLRSGVVRGNRPVIIEVGVWATIRLIAEMGGKIYTQSGMVTDY